MRNFLDEFAKSHRFDPLVASSWYPVKLKHVIAAGGYTLLCKFGTFSKAVASLYPHIGVEIEKFSTHWDTSHRRRNFFDRFAVGKGFNPLDAESWYAIPARAIRKKTEQRQRSFIS